MRMEQSNVAAALTHDNIAQLFKTFHGLPPGDDRQFDHYNVTVIVWRLMCRGL